MNLFDLHKNIHMTINVLSVCLFLWWFKEQFDEMTSCDTFFHIPITTCHLSELQKYVWCCGFFFLCWRKKNCQHSVVLKLDEAVMDHIIVIMMMFPMVDYSLGTPNSNIWHGNQPIMNNFECCGFSHQKKKKKKEKKMMRVAELSFRQHHF